MAEWSFHKVLYGMTNVIVDEEGRYLTGNVPLRHGPLLAAAPKLLSALREIVAIEPPESEGRRIAERVIADLRAEYRATNKD